MLDNLKAWTEDIRTRARPLDVLAAEADILVKELDAKIGALVTGNSATTTKDDLTGLRDRVYDLTKAQIEGEINGILATLP